MRIVSRALQPAMRWRLPNDRGRLPENWRKDASSKLCVYW